VARDERSGTGDRRAMVRVVVIVVLVAVLVWWALANSQRVKIDFLVFERRSRLVYALALSALIGVVVGWVAGRSRGKK
jgi:uncharacterized integral membrane protein